MKNITKVSSINPKEQETMGDASYASQKGKLVSPPELQTAKI